MAGICFGHQLMAQALGGIVRKSDKGWGIGRHVYDIAPDNGVNPAITIYACLPYRQFDDSINGHLAARSTRQRRDMYHADDRFRLEESAKHHLSNERTAGTNGPTLELDA
jgi:hypothetical protein